MAYLQSCRYTPITATQLARAMVDHNTHLPDRAVAVAFDDGFADFYTGALPVLKHYGFAATLYITTGYVGGASRWLLYHLVHLWDRQRSGGEPSEIRRACSHALQSYFAEVFFQDLRPDRSGAVCAIDIDGVLESGPLGFPGLTPAGAFALRALTAHGYQPVLATGRCLDEVRERCRTYPLAGGVAEYGAVIYNHTAGAARELLSEAERADLERLRTALRAMAGVQLDADFCYAVRAYRLDPSGRPCGLSPELVAAALAESGAQGRVRAIAGESQTDFMVMRIDKGVGLRALIDDLGAGNHALGKPLALAVGDTGADLPMFALATLAFAPANADSSVRRAGVQVLRQPYQAGLAAAVARLLGHRPGSCPACRGPRLSYEAHLLLTILAAQERGMWGMLRQALLLGVRSMRAE